ncbi:transcription/translation regulatory transformer protein RfaH [Gallaecimonas sp. GXIMD4217]|uniref:transcription/translation regulatory transformer protein RfaH n=1 Tax=Gallaecimonas sp. GXIMD4217 TaxID=3131927 RepID=UPI00311B373F
MRAWYLLYCKPKQEAKAKWHLDNQGFNTYLPQILVERVKRGRRVRQEEPLFPNYLFIELDDELDNFTAVRSSRGVSDFVRQGPLPLKAPAGLIKDLVLNEERLEQLGAGQHAPKAGEVVVISSGPFSGLKAVYQMPKGGDRALVLVELLGKLTRLEVDNKDIQ